MRIRWVNHPNPKLQHLNGKVVHETRESVAPYILSGQCEEAPYKSTLEFLNDHEAQRQAALPKTAAAGWGIKESTSNDPNAPRFLVVKTTPTGETFFFDSPPSDAPPIIKQRFADAVATDAAQFTDRAAFLKQQQEDYARQHDGTQSEAAGIALTIIGANGVKKS